MSGCCERGCECPHIESEGVLCECVLRGCVPKGCAVSMFIACIDDKVCR